MNAQSRRKIEMGMRALEFTRAHPDADPGYAVAAAKLEQLMARAREGATNQLNGIVDVRAASARKAELRRTMLEVHIAHLAQVGREAAVEVHELGKTFRPKPDRSTYLAFRDAAGTMAAEAQAQRELLVRHGLAASVLDEFAQRLEEFDAAVALGNAGRTVHRGDCRAERGGGRDRPGGAGDGRPVPAAVPGRPAVAGAVGQCEHGARQVAGVGECAGGAGGGWIRGNGAGAGGW